MKHRLLLCLLTLAFAAPALGQGYRAISHRLSAVRPETDSRQPTADGPLRETHRIRIGNRKGGAIEVSLDGGQNWVTVGRVTKPAADTGAAFAGLAGAAPGSVAAVSLDGITVRTDRAPAAGTPKQRIFRLLPAVRVASAAGIVTDLPRGHAIFGSLAPPLGSEVRLENRVPAGRGGTRPLPGGWVPQIGDHLVVLATVPASAPAMLVFENRAGGRVLSVSPSGDERVVGQVRRPLRGVARYPATAGTACGGVVLHHPAAVVVATTPAGAGELGGFLIQPASAFRRAPPASRVPVQAFRESDPNAEGPGEGSVLVVDRLAASGPVFGVPITLSPTGGSLAGETRVEARLDGGPWEPLPAAGGAAPAALTAEALSQQFAALGAPRRLSEGVTHLRLVLAPPSPERLRAALAQAIVEGGARLAAIPAHTVPPRHTIRPGAAHPKAQMPGSPKGAAAKRPRKATRTLRVVAHIQGQGIVYVMFYVDGQIRKMTNTPPFEWLWDTRATPNGTHSLEIRGADADGRILTTQTQPVAVYN